MPRLHMDNGVFSLGSGSFSSDPEDELKFTGLSIKNKNICYTWVDKKGKPYTRVCYDPLEIMILTEVNYSSLWTLEASRCSTSVNSYQPYYGGCDNTHLRVTVNDEFIPSYLNSSNALKALVTRLFEGLNIYSQSNNVKCDKSYLPIIDPIEQPEHFKVKLYDYQKRNLAKMLRMENNNEFEVNVNITLKFRDYEINFDPRHNNYLDGSEEKKIKLKTDGGVLADEMGLGKTITSLALVALNRSNHSEGDPSTFNYVDSKHRDPDDYVIDGSIFTKATLIVCPTHLSKQWETEVFKVFPKCKLIKLLTKTNHVNLKYKEIKDADIIIVTQQFLMNFKYYPAVNYQYCTPANYGHSSRIEHLNTVLNSWKSSKLDILEKTAPNLEHFKFHRLIIDEGHEIFGLQLTNSSMANYMSDWLSSCKSNFKWFVSGTPFVNFNGLINCMKFINCVILDDIATNVDTNVGMNTRSSLNNSRGFHKFLESRHNYSKVYLVDQVLSNIIIRNKKDDVENQIDIPGYTEETIWVDLTTLERNLYNSKISSSRMVLQQLCCHILVADSTSKYFDIKEVDMSKMKDQLKTFHEDSIKKYNARLENLSSDIPGYALVKKNYETRVSESKYMLTILQKMESETDEEKTCSICLDEFVNPTMTSCGHVFCKGCLDMCLSVKSNCPYCKTDLKGKEIYSIATKESKENCSNTNPLIEKYGSKLGKLISVVRKLVIDENNKIIIFSQWDRMLSIIGKTLKENGVSNSFISGNVHCRNSSINKFKMNNNSDNVIMLSLAKSASGTNLTEATHILFVEPIDGNCDEVRAIEAQAIGRACRIGQKNNIKVIRILTKDTIEEQIYKTYKSSQEKKEITNESHVSPSTNIEIEV